MNLAILQLRIKVNFTSIATLGAEGGSIVYAPGVPVKRNFPETFFVPRGRFAGPFSPIGVNGRNRNRPNQRRNEMNADKNEKTAPVSTEAKVPFFARNLNGRGLVIKTNIKAGAGAAEERVK
jgi:hypothetical protein